MSDAELAILGIKIAFGSLAVAILSAYIAARVAWDTRFKPAKIIGAFPYIVTWTFLDGEDGKVSDRQLVPMFWLGNVGAKPILIEDLRLKFGLPDGISLISYPSHSVPHEAIESPNTFSAYGALSTGKAPFCGFALAGSERWKSTFSFHLDEPEYQELKGNIEVSVQIRAQGEAKYKTVLNDRFTFGKPPFSWLNWLGAGGPEARYFYSSTYERRTTSSRVVKGQ